MTRSVRQISESGIYHVVFRGVNHCHIFEDAEDYLRFLQLLEEARGKQPFAVLAYCLMSNHVHLLLQEERPGDLPQIMRRTLSPYSWWFNRKYGRSGALVANRHRSECVAKDSYLLAVVRYIHRNPLAAGMAGRLGDYRWSSYRAYTRGGDGLVSTGLVLGMFGGGDPQAVEEFARFHRMVGDGDVAVMEGTRRSEEDVLAGIKAALGDIDPLSLPSAEDRVERNRLLGMLRAEGYSIRQIERATGVSRGVVAKCVASREG